MRTDFKRKLDQTTEVCMIMLPVIEAVVLDEVISSASGENQVTPICR